MWPFNRDRTAQYKLILEDAFSKHIDKRYLPVVGGNYFANSCSQWCTERESEK